MIAEEDYMADAKTIVNVQTLFRSALFALQSNILCLYCCVCFCIHFVSVCAFTFQTVPSSEYHHRANPPSQHAIYAVQSQRPLLSGPVQTGKGKSLILSKALLFICLDPDFRVHNETPMREKAG